MYDSEKWHRRFLNLAQEVSTWSKDPSTQVGAVIVNPLGQVVGTGYNGFPRGVEDSLDRLQDRETKLKYIVHAELNALLLAGDKAKRSTIYVYPSFGSPPVCNECCKAVIQAGIKQIVGLTPLEYTGTGKDKEGRWAESIKISKVMCTEAGVRVVEIPDGKS